MKVNIGNTVVKGARPDKQSRCAHYHKKEDIIAIQFFCCGDFFCCYKCHEQICDHPPLQWPKDQWNQKAILCGACGYKLTIQEYLQCNYSCPVCKALYNPACQHHYHLYFQT
ncbi:CHY zinc finger protein [Alteribacillus bidgolensis]|uniref:Uncharacterized protein, contains Zn-finger domain of CHY type n=1 Tax=Alteribacillus bidgolensis TaxID=930129 RepID=A0A1G8CFR0_9BACI|nr:CHY zinc finger protein [Alteribacillus bidgolensis]SDH44199.1 Uncharacterized protein, contains Zn-finger domain of CHY type [Alteribacillus bidgolensis]